MSRTSAKMAAKGAGNPSYWVRDEDASSCGACDATFTMTRRKHHCRGCGKVFCGACTSKSRAVPHRGFATAVRVCDVCDSLEEARVAFERNHSRLLHEGAVLTKYAAGMGGPSKRMVRLSADNTAFEYGPPGKGADQYKRLPVQELQRVLRGFGTPVFERHGPRGKEPVCFSLVFSGRSLDLECPNERVCAQWVEAVGVLLTLPRAGADYDKMRRDAAAADKQRALEANSDEIARRRAEREQKKAEMRKKYGLAPEKK